MKKIPSPHRPLTLSPTLLLTFFIAILVLASCSIDPDSLYRDLRDHADKIKVINTHEHQHQLSDYGNMKFGFWPLVAISYLSADLASAGAKPYDPEKVKTMSTDELWDLYGNDLDHTRNTSYYSQFAEGFRKLYGFSEWYFTKANVKDLSARIGKNYEDYPKWFDESFKKCGYEVMILDQYWKPLNTDIDTSHFALAFNIGFVVSGASRRPLKLPGVTADRTVTGQPLDLDDYLRSCDELFRMNVEKHAVCIKNSMAYQRTLYYEDVPYDEAKELFMKKELSQAEAKKIEDYIFHYIIKKATEYNLPVQVHTGYLAGSGNTLENGNPLNLNNLFLEYPHTKFILFHGGFPWTGECAALAKMFPNVYLDLVWLPQISRQEAVNALDVMLDCVPYNKFCWGGDCQLIEESAGALEFAKDVVSEVLANRIKRGLMNRELAEEIMDGIFRENAMKIFALK
ncbi:MAG TPA: amidohydrolase family protein [Bacteroidales bacterium]|nr:amidohydrolase family protein [Bacteroidales bacterium]